MIPSRIRRLSLTHFRNYRAAALSVAQDMVVLVGPNGAGKTNCIEAISLLSPGRGLRRATYDDIADNQGDGSWAVSAEVEGELGLATLGTGIDPRASFEEAVAARRCRIDRETVSSPAAFGDHIRMVWMTPAMDGLFTGAASERRRFFDRLVLALDSQHSARVSALDRSLRSRNRLLEDGVSDTHWLDAVERETAELAVAVAARRGETLTRLAAAVAARANSAFPSARIALDGWMENALQSEPATAVEDRYRGILRDSRSRDAAAGRTLDGPHRTDLQVIYAPKDMPAKDASTGEQKALLIGLVLAHASLVAEMTGLVPLLLLDEVVAHLDPQRRTALFGELRGLSAQVWMTGADPAAFAQIGEAAVFDVDNGRVTPQF